MDPLKPYDITKMVVGAPRVVIAKADGVDAAIVPTHPSDIVAVKAVAGAYPAAADYRDWGATTGGSSYSHGRDTEGNEIDQEAGNIFEEITEINRQFSLNMIELSPENLQVLENATAIETIAAAADKSAQKKVGMGSYSELTQYRVALIGFRKRSAGLVIETVAGVERPRMVVAYLNRVALAGDENEFNFEKGNIGNGDVSVTAFPEPGIDGDEAYGGWFLEEAGTIPII